MCNLSKLPVYLLPLVCLLGPVHAGTVYEEEVAGTLFQRVEQGEPVWLYAGGERFLALFTGQLQDQAQGAAIIVHGMGAHPDWPAVVAPVRNLLPAMGWASLSIQMPLLDPGEPLADYGKTISAADDRLRAAIQFLSDRKFLNIAVIGHGFGAVTAANFLASERTVVRAFAGVSMQTYEFLNPRLYLDEALTKIRIPMLDVYGSADLSEVIMQAQDRGVQVRHDNGLLYTQISIDGADHFFTGEQDLLAWNIHAWLEKVAPALSLMQDDEADVVSEDETPSESVSE